MCFGPSTLGAGAGAKTRLESRIKKFTVRHILFAGQCPFYTRDLCFRYLTLCGAISPYVALSHPVWRYLNLCGSGSGWNRTSAQY